MSQSNSFDPDRMLDRIVSALRDEPIPDFHDPFATDPTIATTNADGDGRPFPVERRAPSQPADFGSRWSTPGPDVARHARGWARPAAWWGLGATGAVVVVLMAVAGLVLRPKDSLAQVKTAVLGKSWVHLRTVLADQGESEAWFSPTKDISAERQGGSARYEDYRLQIYYSYDPAEQVLYRVPLVGTSQATEFGSLFDALKILVQSDRPPEKPLAHLGFLGSERDKMTVLDQRMEKITEQNHTWLDYRITVKYAEAAEPVRTWFRVDTRTKLPQMCRIEGHHDGKAATLEIQFDYPEKGPADIFDLGVPKAAKLVDRVPAGDLKLIVESLNAGRARMDNYRAVFVRLSDRIDQSWWTKFPEFFYRKGDRYRRDFMAGGQRDKGTQKPDADVDLRQWWLDRAKLFRFYPTYVQRGPTAYTTNTKNVIDPDGSQHHEIAAVHKFEIDLKRGDLIPVDYSMRPEFACRPPMGLGNLDQEPTLDLHPAEGPAGCILLTVRHTTKEGRVNEKKGRTGLPGVNRFWLAPQRDYIAMRWDMVTLDETGKETISNSHLIEETARSPQGVWYATKVRRKNAAKDEDGKEHDQIYHIYVDFEAELPDSLFEPPTPRRIE